MAPLGLYGKLPASGDFVSRALPDPLCAALHQFMAQWVGSARERLGESWLEFYLSAPIWRFAASSGGTRMAGVICPSVDKVGRYFPLALVQVLPSDAALCGLLAENDRWLEALEGLALAALAADQGVDELLQEAASIAPPALRNLPIDLRPGVGAALVDGVDNPGPGVSMPALLEVLALAQHGDYSIWRSAGSQWAPAADLIGRGWPSPRNCCALLDGRFEAWEWQTLPTESIQ